MRSTFLLRKSPRSRIPRPRTLLPLSGPAPSGPPASTLVLAALALAAFAPRPAAAQDWTVIPLSTSEDVLFIQKGSFSQRYVVGTGGFVARSTDGTMTAWDPIQVGTSQDLLAIHEPSAGQVWISGAAGTARRFSSPDWLHIDLPTSAEDFVVFSRSSGWSYAVGTAGSIYRTTDAGASWNLQDSGTMQALHAGNGSVSSAAVCVGDGGTILKTENGGVLWTAKDSGTLEDLHAHADVAGGILAAGGGGVIVRSTDAGETWGPVATPTGETLHDIDVSGQNANRVLAVGTGGTCLQSTDAGQTWCSIETGTTTDLYACDMALNGTWVVAGAGGLMLRTETSGGGCVSEVEPRSWGKVKADYR